MPLNFWSVKQSRFPPTQLTSNLFRIRIFSGSELLGIHPLRKSSSDQVQLSASNEVALTTRRVITCPAKYSHALLASMDGYGTSTVTKCSSSLVSAKGFTMWRVGDDGEMSAVWTDASGGVFSTFVAFRYYSKRLVAGSPTRPDLCHRLSQLWRGHRFCRQLSILSQGVAVLDQNSGM